VSFFDGFTWLRNSNPATYEDDIVGMLRKNVARCDVDEQRIGLFMRVIALTFGDIDLYCRQPKNEILEAVFPDLEVPVYDETLVQLYQTPVDALTEAQKVKIHSSRTRALTYAQFRYISQLCKQHPCTFHVPNSVHDVKAIPDLAAVYAVCCQVDVIANLDHIEQLFGLSRYILCVVFMWVIA
jgi:hypothetical protein